MAMAASSDPDGLASDAPPGVTGGKNRKRLPKIILFGLLAVALFTLYESYHLVWWHTAKKLQEEARATAQLRVLVLQSELEKQRAIPSIFADDSDVIAAVSKKNSAELLQISRKFEKLKDSTHSAVIYILDARGICLSASNWALPTSFVGNDYSFRDYFKQAIKNSYAEQFALGTVSRKPGLYLGQRILAGGEAIGVVVVKVEFDEMEAAWVKAPDRTRVVDAANTILLTANPQQRFQQAMPVRHDEFITILDAPVTGWQLQVISSLLPARKAAQYAFLVTAMSEILLVVTTIFFLRRRQRSERKALAETRYRQQLETEVSTRTNELSQINTRLSREIVERQQAEQQLNLLQVDLVQANKLAALGQITAGVAHEINQPLATIRVLADNLLKLQKKPGISLESITDNINNIIRMSERIGHITGELRAFSRKATSATEPVSLKEVVESSILLNKSRLRDNRVKLVCDEIDPAIIVMAGRIRLEQVIVNLLQNAFEALEGEVNPLVNICVSTDANHITLSIIDNGPGISPDVFQKLFTPFITTKLHGLGLGLVIAHDIVRDFGGELRAETSTAEVLTEQAEITKTSITNTTKKGTSFHIKLRRVNHE